MKRFLSLVLGLAMLCTLCGCHRLWIAKTPDSLTEISSIATSSAPTESAPAEENTSSLPEDRLVDVTSAAPSTPQLPQWKTAYQNYINLLDPNEYEGFALVYVDNDEIPELFLMGTCEATGEALCTYSDGSVRTQQYGRLYGLSYGVRTGRYKHFNGNMGHYSLSLCTLENGVFRTVISGMQEEDYTTYDPDTGSLLYRYTLEGDVVTEESFNKTIANWEGGNTYITMATIACSKQEILRQLS